MARRQSQSKMNYVGAARHKLLVGPNDRLLRVACVVCGEMAVDLTVLSVEAFAKMEEAHMMSIAKKLLDS